MVLTQIAWKDVPCSDNIFQSGFWAGFKATQGIESLCFILDSGTETIPLVVFLRTGIDRSRYAYVPRGPQIRLEESARGAFLEELSETLRDFLPAGTVCVRYDTAFPSPFTDPEYYSSTGQWKGAPRPEIRELRINFGTKKRNLRKAPLDHMCPDTVLVDLCGTDDELMARMRQTTRNSIRKAGKSGVEIKTRGTDWLVEWHRIYADTAKRKGFYFEGCRYFDDLFETAKKFCRPKAPDLRIMSAEKDGVPLAGIIIAIYGKMAYYLYAGSSLEMRECMANYGLQWEAIRNLREAGCIRYDLLGVPPNNDPYHSMYGLYTFKTGFGGTLAHYSGCWDYPLDAKAYESLVNAENIG